MNILVVTDEIPFRKHGDPQVTAVNVVIFALLESLQACGHSVRVQTVFPPKRQAGVLMPEEQKEIQAQTSWETLPPLYHSSATESSLFSTLDKRSYGSEVCLIVWSPVNVKVTESLRIPRVVYNGDIDTTPQWFRWKNQKLFTGISPFHSIHSSIDFIRRGFYLLRAEKEHFQTMSRVDVIANVSACNDLPYTKHGHICVAYVGNTWIDEGVVSPPSRTHLPWKIVGHLGHLGRTGSTYGLQFLLLEVCPFLEEAFGNDAFEVHIIGQGEAVPSLRAALQKPYIKMRGFIEDIDDELATSDAFCIFNNAGPYHAAFTRHIIAWSMGLCLVTHTHSTFAIPEIEHMKNALVGKDGKTVAHLLAQACRDASLNAEIRTGGRKTYERHFQPIHVAQRLVALMQKACEHSR